jgi:hypothetical protein
MMRTLVAAAIVIALVLVILGLVLEALFWLFVVGVVLLLIALIAGWIGLRRASSMTRGDRSS